jgi:uncharacterized surface protein with fasciclin (FAS1) repeats
MMNPLYLAPAVSIAFSPAVVSRQEEEPQDIVSTTRGVGSFTTFDLVLEAADWAGVLQGAGPFTVFAPTDEALAKLPEGAIEQLVGDALLGDRGALTRVLKYHVVAGRLTSDQVVQLSETETVSGIMASVRVEGGKVYVGGAQVVTADVLASNGVIHAIDTVMLPPELVAA